jgi:hypothetical protein
MTRRARALIASRRRTLADRDLVEFLAGRRVSVSIASRDGHCVPSVGRAVGYRIDADQRRLAVFVIARQAERLLADIRRSGAVAVVFTEPSTHRTVQVKGSDARVTPLLDGDWHEVSAHADALVAEICPLGHPEPLIRALAECTPQQVVAVRFIPTSAFGQTPGPRAGAVLGEARP